MSGSIRAADAPGSARAFVDDLVGDEGRRVSVLMPFPVDDDQVAEVAASPRVANVFVGDYRTPLSHLASSVVMVGLRHHLSLRRLAAIARAGGRRVSWWSPELGRQTASVASEIAARLPSRLVQLAGDRFGAGAGNRAQEAIIGGQMRRAILAAEAVVPRAPRDPARGVVMTIGSLGAGGAERQLVLTAKGLVDLGVDVSVIVGWSMSGANGFFLPALRDAGIPVACLPATCLHHPAGGRASRDQQDGHRSALGPLLRGGPLWNAIGEDAAALALELMRRRPAVVHSWLDQQNVVTGLAALVASVPRVILSGRNVAPDHFLLHHPSMRPGYRLLLERPSVSLINNSSAGARDYQRWLGSQEVAVRVVHNAWQRRADVDADRVEAWRARHGVRQVPLLGAVFRLADEKRPRLWLDAAFAVLDRVPTAHAVLVGEGPEADAVSARVHQQRHRERVHLLSPSPDVEVAIAAMDVLLLASRQEGLPNVVIEAQAAGVPVVAVGVGGVAEAMQDGVTGVVVDEGQDLVRRLSDAVVGLLLDPARRVSLGAAGRTFVATAFSVERMLDETLAEYRREHG